MPERAVLIRIPQSTTRCAICDVHRRWIRDWSDDFVLMLEGSSIVSLYVVVHQHEPTKDGG